MCDHPNQPDWELLRAAPQQFFELAAGFDRKDLKRSYNHWNRRFKPETHPEEFQRIRAAYEELDRQLRYGSRAEGSERTQQPATSDVLHDFVGNEAEDRSDNLLERLKSESPQSLYLALQQEVSKMPYDYYALAVLSDVCDEQEALCFGKWLLKGIEQFPHDRTLRHALQAYLRSAIPPAELSCLLIQVASVIRDDSFYPLTEPTWEQLLRQQSLDEFVERLRECEKHLRSPDISNKIIFTIRMLRSALWKTGSASREAVNWTSERLAFIDTNFQPIPVQLEYEVDLLALAHQYVRLRRDFIDGGGLRARLDRVLEIYFTEDFLSGDRAVVLQQLQLTRNIDELLGEFPFASEDPPMEAFYPVWASISQEVAARYGAIEDQQIDMALWSKRAQTFLAHLTSKSNSSLLGVSWTLLSFIAVLVKVVIYLCVGSALLTLPIIILVATSWAGTSESAAILAITALVCVVVVATKYAGHWASEKLMSRFYQPRIFRLAARCNKKLWRPEAVELLERSRLPFSTFCDLLAYHANRPGMSTAGWIHHFISTDYGLAVCSLALRHVV